MRNLASRLVQFGEELIEGKRKGRFFLYPAGLLYGFVSACRNWLYRRGIFAAAKVPRTVVSVGNIVAGGTGKTPLTLLLAKTFADRKPAVLSRGSSVQGSLSDEPRLLQKRCPETKVYLGKSRFLSAERAISEGREFLLLDDGFQHQKLKRDFDLVVLSTDDPFGRGGYLPYGFLRDSPKRLKEADVIFLNPIHSEGELEAWRRRLGGDVPLIGVRLERVRGEISGAKVALFCGISKPDRFKKTVVDAGAIVVQEKILADHEMILERDLAALAEESKRLGAKYLVCTEKDFVKLDPRIETALPIIYLEMEMKITAGVENWQKLIAKIGQKIDNC
ncbi:MAG: tetraacyldisaccharide 4'-kinase [Verrucomicrobia bacterium]|nr:tetraacyldisaccharide 4'-kinase [Verrucomicrobiota bacterium]